MHEDIYFVSDSDDSKPFYISLAGISYCDGTYHINRKHSDTFCIEYIMEGEGTVCCDDKKCIAKKGDVYMLMYDKNHNYYSSSQNPWTKIWFNAAGPLIESLVNSYKLEQDLLFSDVGGEAYEFFNEILEICKQNISPEEKNRKSALIFHRLIRFLYERCVVCQSGVSSDAVKIKEYIETHITDNISIERLSKLIYKSPAQTIRIFRHEYGETPYDYLLNQRFSQAKVLLCNTNMKVKDIAFKIGFSDEHYFSYMFKKHIGLSPREYRSKNDGNISSK